MALVIFCSSLNAAQVPATAFGFSLVPKKLIVGDGRSEIVLSLVLLPQSEHPGVELQAASKGGKTHITYSKPLKKFMKSRNLHRKDFKSFEFYLKAQMKKAKANPDPFIIMLDTYLKTQVAPAFIIDLN